MASYTVKDFLKYSSELATISPAAVELINKITLSNTRRDEIARLVSADEIIFANVFKYTNSAAFAGNRKPKNINEAIDILGINEVRNIVFSVAARKVFVDLDLWRQSVFTAITSQKIAQKLNIEANQISNIYIAGLMQSIGSLVFKMFFKKEYTQIEAVKNYKAREIIEEKIFGINNIKLAYEIVKDYQLPESIVDIIRTQALDWDSESYKKENAIINIAIALSELPIDKDISQNLIDKAINPQIISRFELYNLDISPEFLNNVYEEAEALVNF